jgi:NDP-sugar pyrophosphorylase family protein
MDRILICPGERAAVGFLAQTTPLVAIPILGEPLINQWLEALARSGSRDLLILATDRPDVVRGVVGDGSRWGVRVQVQAELKEPTSADALARGLRCTHPDSVVMLDHLPGLPELPLFRSYRDWFSAVLAWMPQAAQLDRIGLREIQPQVWCGRRTHIAPSAQLKGPCWLGDHVRVGANAVIGPNAVLEDGVVVDSTSEIQSSVVGPDTLVGKLTRVQESIAWGSVLINWRTGSCTQVPDPFLLSALGQRRRPGDSRSILESIRTGLSQLVPRTWVR